MNCTGVGIFLATMLISVNFCVRYCVLRECLHVNCLHIFLDGRHTTQLSSCTAGGNLCSDGTLLLHFADECTDCALVRPLVLMTFLKIAMVTIYLCSCEDILMNDGSTRQPYFMSRRVLGMMTTATHVAALEELKRRQRSERS